MGVVVRVDGGYGRAQHLQELVHVANALAERVHEPAPLRQTESVGHASDAVVLIDQRGVALQLLLHSPLEQRGLP